MSGAAAGGHGSLSDLVSEYYQDVDHRDFDAAMSCFAQDAVYHRPGYGALVGLPAISTFYRSERVISHGRHRLELIVENELTVAVRGRFDGTSHAGDQLAVRFADFWSFSGVKVVERHTYFDAAAV